MREVLDDVEREYLRAIERADTDVAYELSIALREYRDMYKASIEVEQ